MQSVRVLAIVLLAASPLAAQRQIFVVDAANGPGAQFTSLPAAVAAVPDGSVLLLRPGSYAAFAVSGKGLSIVGAGEDPHRVTIGSPILAATTLSITDTTAKQTFMLKNVWIRDTFGGGVDVLLQDDNGAVIWEDVAAGNNGGVSNPGLNSMRIVRCANVQLSRCFLDVGSCLGGCPQTARFYVDSSNVQCSRSTLKGTSGSAALWLVQGSRCEMFASSVTGSSGGPPYCGPITHCPGPGYRGQDAVLVDQSAFIALRTQVTGGSEGGGLVGGGNGIVLVNAARAVFEGSSPAAGYGPAIFGNPPAPYVLSMASTIQINAASLPSIGAATARRWASRSTSRSKARRAASPRCSSRRMRRSCRSSPGRSARSSCAR
jgi:hypothetical protein